MEDLDRDATNARYFTDNNLRCIGNAAHLLSARLGIFSQG
jgi:hypothetical protein